MTDYPNLFVEVCEGLRRDIPPIMIKRADLSNWKAAHEPSEAGLFSSIFAYSTLDPYVGGIISDLYFDFDREDNPGTACSEAIAVIKRLTDEYKIPEVAIFIAFSGCKGISVTVNYQIFNVEPSNELPLIWKSIAQDFATKLKLKTLDLVIYDRRRLWRMLNSKHNKTGLYKIPLTLTELENLRIEQIKALATKPREPFIKSETKAVKEAELLYLKHKNAVEHWAAERKQDFKPTEIKPTADDPPCVKRLLENGAHKGNRNNATFQLAVYYTNKGLAFEDTQTLCSAFASRSEEPLSQTEIETIVKSAVKGVQEKKYSVGCSTDLLAEFCDKESCPFFNSLPEPWANIGEPISFEEWKNTVIGNFPHLWAYAEACASTVAVLLIKDVQPLALVLQGAPSGGKTTTLDFFKNFPFSHSTDKFTARSFVSHVAQKSEAELKKIDLLPRLKGKVLITPDLTTLFGAKAEDLAETFSLLTRVLDGQGLTIDSGVYGARGYSGDYMFSWIGATTPIPHKVWDLFGNLGARMYFMQIVRKDKTNSDYVASLKEKNYRIKVNDCNAATLRFLRGIWREERIEWNSTNDPDQLIERVVQLAKVVTRLRGKINVAVSENKFGQQETNSSSAIIEEPERCIQALYGLMRGHSLIQGRTQVSTEDIQVVIDVALSSAPYERVAAFAHLLKHDSVSTSQLMAGLQCSRHTAIRTMKVLELLNLADLQQEGLSTFGGEQTGYIMRLKEEFAWFKSKEFQQLWRLQPQEPKQIEKTKPSEEAIERVNSMFGREPN
jgi:Eukaryotic-type DNA primase, large subunit